MAHPDLTREWCRSSNFLVVLNVPDEAALAAYRDKLIDAGLRVTSVIEPDLDDQLTAVVVEPGAVASRLLSSLPLALREPAMT